MAHGDVWSLRRFGLTRCDASAAWRSRRFRRVGGAMVVAGRIVPVLLLGALVVRRWEQIGPYVSGLDGGNWFAIGRRLFRDGGATVGGVYPPLIPVLLSLGQRVADALLVAKVVGIGSFVAVIGATYVVARRDTNRWFALSIAMTVGLANALTETVAFGGYPQNYACAFALLAAYAFARYLAEGRRSSLLGTAAALVGAALSHHLFFAMSCAMVAFIWVVWLTERPKRDALIARTVGMSAAVTIALACVLPTFIGLWRAGYAPAANIAQYDLVTAFQYATHDAPFFWLGVMILGVVATACSAARRATTIWKVQSALLLAVLPSFLLTHEARLIPLLLIGATLAVGAALHAYWVQYGKTVRGIMPALGMFSIPLLLWVPSDTSAIRSFAHYRVLDRSLVAAAGWLDIRHPDGRIVVRDDRRGWPVGWWFEGLTGAPIIVGSDEKYLFFPSERDRARLASRFFAPNMSTRQVADLAHRSGVTYLVFRKRDWIGWRAWITEPDPQVRVVFDDNEYMILAVADQPAGAA